MSVETGVKVRADVSKALADKFAAGNMESPSHGPVPFKGESRGAARIELAALTDPARESARAGALARVAAIEAERKLDQRLQEEDYADTTAIYGRRTRQVIFGVQSDLGDSSVKAASVGKGVKLGPIAAASIGDMLKATHQGVGMRKPGA